MELRTLAPNRVWIQGANGVELVRWLEMRDDVVAIAPRADGRALEVSYDPRHGTPGGFMRSLRERLVVSDKPPSLTIELSHGVFGRARLTVCAGARDAACRLAAWMATRPGVRNARGESASGSVVVAFDPDVTSAEALLAAARESDETTWPPAPAEPPRAEWVKTAFNTAVLGTTVMAAVEPPIAAVLAGLTAIPSAQRAAQALAHRKLTVDVLDVAAIGISIATGSYPTAAFMTWLLGVGDLVLERTADRARRALASVARLDVTDAWRIAEDGSISRVPVGQIRPHDRIAISAGERLPVDGTIDDGTVTIDAKAITGESLPVTASPGDRVMAASIVVEGTAVVRVERTGKDTTAARIVQILEGAGAKPMTLQANAEQNANRLVAPTLLLAGAAGLLSGQLERATSILIMDFGTGIRITVPTSALTAITLAARSGVIVKGGQYLERLARADVVVFDKTGTLTRGEPDVSEVITLNGMPRHQVLALTLAAEMLQQHPVAEAIRRCAAREGVEPAPAPELCDASYELGKGVAARIGGHDILVGRGRLFRERGVEMDSITQVRRRMHERGASSILVAVDGRLEAVIAYADAPRDESAAVVQALRAGRRREVVLMSGDAELPANAIGRRLGVDRVHAELLPEDKATLVRELQTRGRVVAMVGDGINDAPALALADVGISLTGSTDVALEAADVVLLDKGLAQLPDVFALADSAMADVRRGLGLVLVPNAAAMVFAALGLVPPGLAAAVNNGSTIVAAVAAVAPLLRGELRDSHAIGRPR